VPLAGIVILKRGLPEITLYRVEPERFLPELFSVGAVPSTKKERARSFGGVVDLASSVPLWLLDRPLEFATLDEVVDRVTSTCLPSETGR